MSKKSGKYLSVNSKRNTGHNNRLIFALSLVVALVVLCTVGMLIYNDYLYGDTSKPDTTINYEEALLNDAASYSYIYENLTIDSLEFDPYGMENGLYSIYINNESEPYMYQGGNLWPEEKDLETLNAQTTFTDFSKREENIIASARNLVCKYIEDSKVLTDKDRLIERIRTIPFYKYTDSFHPELISVMDSPAVHMGIGIYCNEAFDEFFCEYMVVHELIHHLRYLTNGEMISEELYFATGIDEGIADLITFTINPVMFDNPNYVSSYVQFYEVLYDYLAVFKEEALKAYFYGYSDFFTAHGGKTFETEHNLFAVALGSYAINYNTPWVCDTLFSTWNARFNEG